MTALLDQAFEAIRRIPEDEQDAVARMMLDLVSAEEVELDIPPEDLPDVLAGIAEADRGEFATESEVQAALQRLRA